MLTIDNSGLVSDAEALRMALMASGRGDGIFQVADGLAVRVRGDSYAVVQRCGSPVGVDLEQFLNSFPEGTYVSNTELFALYVEFGGTMSREKFFRRIANCHWKRRRSGKERGWVTANR